MRGGERIDLLVQVYSRQGSGEGKAESPTRLGCVFHLFWKVILVVFFFFLMSNFFLFKKVFSSKVKCNIAQTEQRGSNSKRIRSDLSPPDRVSLGRCRRGRERSRGLKRSSPARGTLTGCRQQGRETQTPRRDRARRERARLKEAIPEFKRLLCNVREKEAGRISSSGCEGVT